MNAALQLFDSGFTDLVSVIPPGSTLAEGTTIKPDSLGKVPGVQKADGTWAGYPWTTQDVHRPTAKRWSDSGANIGIKGDRWPGLDIDCDDPQLADVVHKFAVQQLGEAPVRLSRDPRRLLVYRTAAPFARVALVITWKSRSHTVEWLCDGRQYLVSGKHPSGVDYRWSGIPLWEWSPDDLCLITGDRALAFLKALGAALQSKGAEVELVGTGAAQAAPPPQDDLKAPSIEALGELVAKLPNVEEHRSGYMNYLYAIKAAGQDDEVGAKVIALDWASRWEGGHNDLEWVEADWDSLHGPYRLGWSFLLDRAQAAGEYSAARDAFVADLEAPDTSVGILDSSSPWVEGPDRVRYTDEWVTDQVRGQVEGELRYVASSKAWYVWDGHRWLRDEGMDHQLRLREILRNLCLDLEARGEAAPGREGGPIKTAARKFQGASGIKAVGDLLQAYVAVPQDAFDADPYLLNTPSGVVDLKTGTIVPPDPAQLHARSTAVGPAEGPAPAWAAFLRDLTGSDPALVRYLQKVTGYTLAGDISEKTLWFIWGSDADTGKSTFIRVISELLGDYHDTVDVDTFVGPRRGEIPADLARLPGVRLVTATEPSAGHSWDEKRIKAITGGDEITARFLYGQPFTYSPQFKIVIVGNHEPEIRVVDDAMLRRIHIVPFNRKVPREKQIENLSQKLLEREGPQILHWMIEGCVAWQREGLTPPSAVTLKTAEYKETEDTFGAWLEEECELGEDFTSSRQELYSAWAVWCRQRGEESGTEKTFKRRIGARKLSIRDRLVGARRLHGYGGIRLNLRVEMGTDA